MLETASDVPGEAFAHSVERYLSETLHASIRLKPFQHGQSLPVFLRQTYGMFEGWIADRECVFLVLDNEAPTPSQIAKHVALVHSRRNAVVIFAAPSISAHNRSRLVARAVPFVVPGNQLYIPQLAMDLREHFRAHKAKANDGLSPAAQAVLFHHVLRRDETATTPSKLAKALGYSAMSIGRAFDDLAAEGLAEERKRGKERHIRFPEDRRELFETAKRILRSPVRKLRFIEEGREPRGLKISGETALAELSDLARPSMRTWAVAANDWKVVGQSLGLREVDASESFSAVETWSYDPAALSDDPLVDPLSLYAQFHDHRDERVAMAAERLLERIKW